MSVPIALRTDFDAAALRREAKATKDAAQGRRLLALAEVYNGGTRTDAARIGGVGLQTIRDWVLAFNRKGPAGLVNGKAPGQPSKLNDDQRRVIPFFWPTLALSCHQSSMAVPAGSFASIASSRAGRVL